ncbi:MAG TPA: hypothetical protein VNH18_23065 [Bryobacteraceae bacterium]|nr:hypothetical protein [Bryobacteraceae bacterium]
MNRRNFLQLAAAAPLAAKSHSRRKTAVSIRHDQFFINGKVTYAGRTWQGKKIEGLLMNSRVVQGIFDDANTETARKWAYPDTGKWDPERNTSEFIAAMPDWRKNGLLAFTINLQGGSPEGYSKGQPWDNTAFDAAGKLKPAYMARLKRILDRADELGMVAIVGYFYFGQDERLKNETAVKSAVINATRWLLDEGYRNVLVEVDNECNIKAYDHDILKADRVHELIDLVKNVHPAKVKGPVRKGATPEHHQLLVGTSYGGGTAASSNVVKVSDFLLLHGNGADDPSRIRKMIETSRAADGYRRMPVLINEDDHFRFGDADNHLLAALDLYVSWGYFDPGASNYADGYQCPPINWGINTERKQQFFAKLKEITGV